MTDEKIDLLNEVPTVGFTVSSNNETVGLYGDGLGGELGIIEHEYEGLPARGVVRFDVNGYEIVEDLADDPEEPLEDVEEEIREWIEDAMFNSDISSTEANVYRENTHVYRVENPYESDDKYMIKLEVTNKRRIK